MMCKSEFQPSKHHRTPRCSEAVQDPTIPTDAPGTLLFFAVILAELNEIKDIQVPRLQIHGKGALTCEGAQPSASGDFCAMLPLHGFACVLLCGAVCVLLIMAVACF